jgi:3-oxoacyl-[acyl-carrier-protein] synthase II
MMLKLTYGSSICCQNTFGEERPYQNLKSVHEDESTKIPIYKTIIPPMKLRRMSQILRMSLATAILCHDQIESDFDAIVFGTALGCLKNTFRFADVINTSNGAALSPTAFIQSTHNTISGQISLFFKNHSYNITHSQLNVSFEMGLLDCMNCFASNYDLRKILVGAADEKIDFLTELQPEVIPDNYPLTEISTTFIVEPESELKPGDIGIEQPIFEYSGTNIEEVVKQHDIDLSSFDLILHSGISSLEQAERINYLEFTGFNYSASALAIHYAYDRLKHESLNSVLIVNNLCKSSTGIVILRKIE